MKVALGLPLVCAYLGTSAQTYRINYQPKVGSIVRHKLTLDYLQVANGPGPEEAVKAKVILRLEQKFNKVSADMMEVTLVAKTLAINVDGDRAPDDLKRAHRHDFKIRLSYQPSNPLGMLTFLGEAFPGSAKDVFAFVTIPSMPPRSFEAGGYWPLEGLTTLPGDSVLGRARSDNVQSTLQHLSSENGAAFFESMVNIPFETQGAYLSVMGDLSVRNELTFDLGSSVLEKLRSTGRLRSNIRVTSKSKETRNLKVSTDFSLLVQRL